MRQKGFTQIVVAILLLILIGGGIYYFGIKNGSTLLTTTPVPTSIATGIPTQKTSTKKPIEIISSDISLPHELLPGFNINVPSGWIMKIKQFGEENRLGFTPKYWAPPNYDGGYWMGIRIEKGNISINLIFDIVVDNNFYGCSDTANFENIGNNWTRIKDSSGYFYTTLAKANTTPFSGNDFGKLSDEWSVVEGHTYKICYQGTGMMFESDPPKNLIAQEGGIMLENPRILGEPSDSQLSEIDSMVKSIQGIR